jgi:sn-glycerol 3-phosphate transport system permease protein
MLARARVHARRQGAKRFGAGVALLGPALMFLVPFTLYPSIRVLWSSLFLADLAHPHPTFLGLGNYAFELTNPVFWKVVRNTLTYVVLTVPISLALGFLLAVEADKRLRLVGYYRTALFYPSVLPSIGASAIWLYIYLPNFGLADRLFQAVGMSAHNWLGTPALALPSLIVLAVWKLTGYYLVLFLGGLQSLSRDIFEAAGLDGATGYQMLARLTLPLMLPTTIFVSTVALINGFQTVDQLFILTDGGPNNSTNLLLYFLYQEGFKNFNTGRASALTVMLQALLLLLSLVNYRSLDRLASYES